MKTYQVLTGPSGRTVAFEVENSYISPRSAARLLTDVNGVTDVVRRANFSSSGDVHVQFKLRGLPYVVWEPFGDSSRYWIGPADVENQVEDISELEAKFKQYRPPLYRIVFGDLLTLKFITLALKRLK